MAAIVGQPIGVNEMELLANGGENQALGAIGTGSEFLLGSTVSLNIQGNEMFELSEDLLEDCTSSMNLKEARKQKMVFQRNGNLEIRLRKEAQEDFNNNRLVLESVHKKKSVLEEWQRRREHRIAELKAEVSINLKNINDKVALEVTKITTQFHKNREVDLADIVKGIKNMSEPAKLASLRKDDLIREWQGLREGSLSREKTIDAFESKLIAVETGRADQTSSELLDLGERLKETEYPNPTSAVRFVQEEAAVIDIQLVENKKSVINYCYELRAENVQVDMRLKLTVDDVVEKWRKERFNSIFYKFRTALQKSQIDRDSAYKTFRVEQVNLFKKIDIHLLNLLKVSITAVRPNSIQPWMAKSREFYVREKEIVQKMCKALQDVDTKEDSVIKRAKDDHRGLLSECELYQHDTLENIMKNEANKCGKIDDRPSVDGILQFLRSQARDHMGTLLLVGAYFQILAKSKTCHNDDVINTFARSWDELFITEKETYEKETEDVAQNLAGALESLSNIEEEILLSENLGRTQEILNSMKDVHRNHHGRSEEIANAFPDIMQRSFIAYNEKICFFLDLASNDMFLSKSGRRKSKVSFIDSHEAKPATTSSRPSSGKAIQRASNSMLNFTTKSGNTYFKLTEDDGVTFFARKVSEYDDLKNLDKSSGAEIFKSHADLFSTEPVIEFPKLSISLEDISVKTLNTIRDHLQMSFVEDAESWKYAVMTRLQKNLLKKVTDLQNQLHLKLYEHEAEELKVESAFRSRSEAIAKIHFKHIHEGKVLEYKFRTAKQTYDAEIKTIEELQAKFMAEIPNWRTLYRESKCVDNVKRRRTQNYLDQLHTRFTGNLHAHVTETHATLRVAKAKFNMERVSLSASLAQHAQAWSIFKHDPSELDGYLLQFEPRMKKVNDELEDAKRNVTFEYSSSAEDLKVLRNYKAGLGSLKVIIRAELARCDCFSFELDEKLLDLQSAVRKVSNKPLLDIQSIAPIMEKFEQTRLVFMRYAHYMEALKKPTASSDNYNLALSDNSLSILEEKHKMNEIIGTALRFGTNMTSLPVDMILITPRYMDLMTPIDVSLDKWTLAKTGIEEERNRVIREKEQREKERERELLKINVNSVKNLKRTQSFSQSSLPISAHAADKVVLNSEHSKTPSGSAPASPHASLTNIHGTSRKRGNTIYTKSLVFRAETLSELGGGFDVIVELARRETREQLLALVEEYYRSKQDQLITKSDIPVNATKFEARIDETLKLEVETARRMKLGKIKELYSYLLTFHALLQDLTPRLFNSVLSSHQTSLEKIWTSQINTFIGSIGPHKSVSKSLLHLLRTPLPPRDLAEKGKRHYAVLGEFIVKHTSGLSGMMEEQTTAFVNCVEYVSWGIAQLFNGLLKENDVAIPEEEKPWCKKTMNEVLAEVAKGGLATNEGGSTELREQFGEMDFSFEKDSRETESAANFMSNLLVSQLPFPNMHSYVAPLVPESRPILSESRGAAFSKIVDDVNRRMRCLKAVEDQERREVGEWWSEWENSLSR